MPSLPDTGRARGMPSLLRSLLSDHLDPGYAAAAAARQRTDGARPPGWLWQALAALLIAAVFALAVAAARSTAPGVSAAQRGLAAGVSSAQQRTAGLTERRDELAAQSDVVERGTLAADATGRTLLAELDALSLGAASTVESGPGLAITATEPQQRPDLTDASRQRLPGTRQVILDRDLQLVVNALWAGGAEAVAVGGVRIGPGVTIRQAGEAILVDNQPIAGPYRVLAIGPPARLAESFGASTALQRLRLLETAYRVGVTVSAEEELTVPASPAREVKFGRREGP
ncbi:MAG: DUF881 domain-containing protein [Mycobacterium sp.]